MQLPAAHGSREVPEVLLQRLTSLSRPLSANALRSLGQHSAAAAGAPSLPAAAALIPPSLRSHLPVAPKRRYHHPSGEQGVRRRWQARWPFCGTGLVNTPIQLQRLASLHFPLPFSRSTPLQGRAVKMAAAATGHPPPSCGGGHPHLSSPEAPSAAPYAKLTAITCSKVCPATVGGGQGRLQSKLDRPPAWSTCWPFVRVPRALTPSSASPCLQSSGLLGRHSNAGTAVASAAGGQWLAPPTVSPS